MPHRLRFRWLLLLLLPVAGASGCVERRLVIAADPYDPLTQTIVYDEKNRPIGAAPVDHPFPYYGVYQFRLVKDGYETLVVQEKIRAPWYELPGLDFISENLIPWTIRDKRYLKYTLQPVQVMPPELLLKQAQDLRDYDMTIGAPLPRQAAPVAPPAPIMPPADNNAAPIAPAPQLLPPTP